MRYEEYWASKMRKKCSNLIAEKGPVLQSRYLGLPLSEFIQKCKTFHQSTAGVTLDLVMLKQFNIITSCLSLSVDFFFCEPFKSFSVHCCFLCNVSKWGKKTNYL